MKAKITLLLFFLILPFTAEAQKEGNIWYFGLKAGLDFNSGSPVVLTNGQIATEEGCSSICDADGNLLFYTDGIKVWNQDQDTMPNGNNLYGHSSSTQSGVIVPKPQSDNLYYIFTVTDKHLDKGFRYSIVDMNLDNGKGAVTDKNILLFEPTAEKITAVKHKNKTDIWVIGHGWENNQFYAYLITKDGINSVENSVDGYPVLSSVGSVHEGSEFNKIGYMKASPAGNKICLAINDSRKFELFDFNNETGVISNPITFEGDKYSKPYGVEFSPNGRMLYLTTEDPPSRIYQYDLSAGDEQAIKQSEKIVAEGPSMYYFSSLQVGPDQKIYCARYNRSTLSVIGRPNESGDACDFQDNAIDLDPGVCFWGLPTYIQSYFYNSTSTNIYMGKLHVDETKDSVVSEFIKNTGTDPFTVKSLALSGPESDQFEILSSIENKELAPGEYFDVEFRFKPTSLGRKRANIIITLNIKTMQQEISGDCVEKEGPLSGINVNMGQVYLNKEKDSVVNAFIKNGEAYEVNVNDILIANNPDNEFEMLDPVPPFNIPPAGTINAKFRFSPKSVGVKSSPIIIYAAQDTISQTIIGEGIQKELAIQSVNVNMGQVVLGLDKDSVITGYLKNTGQDAVEIDSITISGVNKNDFSIITGMPPYTLASDQSGDVEFKFTPGGLGFRNALVNIYFEGETLTQSIRGEGIEGVDTTECDETWFKFPIFTSVDKLKFVGKSHNYFDFLRLTNNIPYTVGGVWYSQQIPVRNGFITKFKFRFTDGDNANAEDGSYPGADGIAFVIQNFDIRALGLAGGNIGYAGIPNSLAVEFDSYSNDKNQIEDYKDPNGHHVAVISNGKDTNSAVHMEDSDLGTADLPELKSDWTIYYVKIEYNLEPNTLNVFFDKTGEFAAPVLTVNNLQLGNLLNLDQGEAAYIGFTAATGSAFENQDILSWEFCPKPSNWTATDVEDTKTSNGIFTAYPNPFDEIIYFEVSNMQKCHASLKIYDVLGNEKAKVFEGSIDPGSHRFDWMPEGTESGRYIAVLTLGDKTFTAQVNCIK